MWPFKKKPRAPRDPNWEEKAKAEGWEPTAWMRDAYDNGWRPGPKAGGWIYASNGFPMRTPPRPPLGFTPTPDYQKPPPPAAPPSKAP